MRVLLIDDEPRARRELQRVLSAHADVEVVGEAEDVPSALTALQRVQPDLLFLDVQMPGENGFDLLAKLDHVPAVIFCTAFDQHAVRAFEVNALDYILKPVDPRRIAEALDRVRSSLETTVKPPNKPESTRLQRQHRVFVRDGERCWFVRIAEVEAFESVGNYAKLYLPEARPIILRSLNVLEDRLDPELFFRASRQFIINLEAIATVEPWFGDSLRVVLKSGLAVELSRRQAAAFRERLSL